MLVRLAAAITIIVAMVAPADAANVLDLKTEYSAASTIQTAKAVLQGRLWRTPMALRHESTDGARQHTVIMRLDRKVAWLLMPEQKLAIEMGLENFGLPAELLTGSGIRQTPLGQETIGGLRTTKVRVEREAKPNANSHFEGFVWTTAEGVIMKLTGSGENQGKRGEVKMSFSDVKLVPQDPALFELPSGYRRLALVGVDFESLLNGIDQLKGFTVPKHKKAGASPH